MNDVSDFKEDSRRDGGDLAIQRSRNVAAVDPINIVSSKGEESSLDLSAVLRIIREWRWLILAGVALGIAAGIVLALLTTPLYRADVTLEVNPPTVEILDEKQRQFASSVDSYSFIVTQVGLLRSRSLAERVAQDLNLASDPAVVGKTGDAAGRLKAATGVVAGGLEVALPEDGQLIKFSYVSDSADRAARIANGIADGFISSGVQRRYEASDYARNFLQKQIAKTRGDLENSERALVEYAQAQGILENASKEGETGGSLQGQTMYALNSALAEATAKRVAAEGAYRQSRLAAAGSEGVASTSGLRTARAALEAEYQDKRTLLKPDHPDMLSLRARINEIDRQIAAERSTVAGGSTNTLLAQYRAAQAAENSLRGQVGGLKGSVLNLRGRSIRYNTLQRDVDTSRGLYDALLQRYKEIGVGGGVGSSPVTIVDRAEAPGGPFKPNLIKNILFGLLGGLVAGLALAVLLDFLNDTIKTRDDVREKLGLACLGAIPKAPAKSSLIEELEDNGSQVSEAYAAVLASLRFSSDHGAPRALLLSSARPSEGKSSSALALAHSYARRGERVLLIDADLRRPAFASLSKSVGITNLLTSEEPLQAHVIATNYENLLLLPCGPVSPNPSDLLSTPRFGAILDEALRLFDRVIIDGPPALGVADASLLAAAVGSVMICIEAGKTRTRAARDLVERLRQTGAHVIGATLTMSTVEASHYGYGYGYYRYTAVEDRQKDQIQITHSDES